jgi:nitrous oxidase accessory protein NosD
VTGATGPTGAAVGPCLVEDANTGKLYGTFQAAVAAAASGDTLNVHGTCEGDTTIEKNLTVQGQGSGATLNGENRSGSVLTINSATVSISGLTITGGNVREGGGIYAESGALTLAHSTVTGNAATYGGGIFTYCTVTLIASSVNGNTAAYGAGIFLYGAVVTLTEASVVGGGVFNNGGSFTLESGSKEIGS